MAKTANNPIEWRGFATCGRTKKELDAQKVGSGVFSSVHGSELKPDCADVKGVIRGRSRAAALRRDDVRRRDCIQTDGESRGSAENGGERNGRRLGLASTETEAIRTGHGDADLDDGAETEVARRWAEGQTALGEGSHGAGRKVTRRPCFANRAGGRRLQRRLGMVEKKEKLKKNRGGGRGSKKKRRRRAMVVGWRVRLEVGHGEGENRKRK